jgi:hypothetical protein
LLTNAAVPIFLAKERLDPVARRGCINIVKFASGQVRVTRNVVKDPPYFQLDRDRGLPLRAVLHSSRRTAEQGLGRGYSPAYSDEGYFRWTNILKR